MANISGTPAVGGLGGTYTPPPSPAPVPAGLPMAPSRVNPIFPSMSGPQTPGLGNNGYLLGGDNNVSPYAGTQTDPNAPPITPNWNPLFGPSDALAPSMQQMVGGVSYNENPLNNLASYADSQTPSTWAQLQSQLSRTQTGQGLSNAANQTAGSTAQTMGNLAMSGGLSSGAGERAQEIGQLGGINAAQGVENQGNQQLLNIASQDAQQKLQAKEMLPGMETQAYQAQLEPIQMIGQAEAQDVAHAMANAGALNQFNMDLYGNQAAMYGANQTAAAQQAQAQAQPQNLWQWLGF